MAGRMVENRDKRLLNGRVPTARNNSAFQFNCKRWKSREVKHTADDTVYDRNIKYAIELFFREFQIISFDIKSLYFQF